MSIAAIADELGVHPNTVRFHLRSLVDSRQIESVPVDHTVPGRPPSKFRMVPGMDPTGPRRDGALAAVLAGALASEPDATERATAAGRAWATQLAGAGTEPSKKRALDRLTRLLAELDFDPESPHGSDEIALRHCPFLDIALENPTVVCSVHLGMMRGALEQWRAPVTVETVVPFVQPDRCIVHVVRARRAS